MVVGFLGDSNHTSMAQHVGVQPPPFVHLEYLPILARTLYLFKCTGPLGSAEE